MSNVHNIVYANDSGTPLVEMPYGTHVPTATNLQIQSNDLTNIEWTATNVTPAQDVEGIDGFLTSACTLTATAGNGTVVGGAITAASGNHATVWYLKRKTGTGAIELTLDNGGTWQDVTAQVNSGWTLVAVDQAALTNPQIGIRIVVNADAVYVGNAECYEGTTKEVAATLPPIFTTAASVSRDSCDLTLDSDNYLDSAGSLILDFKPSLATANMAGDVQIISTHTVAGMLYYNVAAGAFRSTDGTNTSSKTQALVAGECYRIGVVWSTADNKLRIYVDGVAGTEVAYDGAFASGAALSIFKSCPYVAHARSIKGYSGKYVALTTQMGKDMITYLTGDNFIDRLTDEDGLEFTV